MSLRLVTVIVVSMVVTIAAQVRSDAAGTASKDGAPAAHGSATEARNPGAVRDEAYAGSRTPSVRAAGESSRCDSVRCRRGALQEEWLLRVPRRTTRRAGPQGPRLGPNPIPLPRFVAYVRNPTGDMPPFTAKVISDQDLASIYAFLQARPTPPPVKDIPLLAP